MASVCLPRNYTERENSDFGRYCVGKSCTSILMLIAVTRRSKKDRKKDGVEKKEMTFRQVTKEEKGPNIAVRSPIAEKRRRESEEKEKPFRNPAGLPGPSGTLCRRRGARKKNNLLVLDQVEKWPVAVPFPAGVDYF
jgi:hypothetical protein